MSNFQRLVRYLQPYRWRFGLAGLLVVVSVAGELATPWLFGLTVDRGLTSGNLRTVAGYAALLLLAMLVRASFGYLQWNVQHQVGQDVIRDLRNQLYNKLQALPSSFYRAMPTGQIMSRMTGDVEAVLEYLGWGLLVQFAAVVSFVGTAGMLLWIDTQLTLVLALPLLPLAVVVFLFDRGVGPAWERVREQMGELTTVLQENISGVRVVKAFAQEGRETGKFGASNEEQRQLNLRRGRLEANAFPLMDLFIGVAFVLLAWYGGRRVMAGETTIGTFFAYQWYLWGIIWPVRFMGWMISMMRGALSAAPRLFEIVDAPPAIADAAEARVLPRVRGDVRFEGVSFAFPDEPDRAVLNGLDLHIRPGEVVAVLGGTGSGKTSLMTLIPRFYDVTAGRVLVDGQDVRDMTLDSLRHQIAFVPQEAFLFSASVRDNIAYGRPDATDEEIFEAARQAQAHEFILDLPQGYAAMVGERGIGLSGGQKQRLALARALLMDPPILLLDEATSAVDTETEHEIQQALERVMRGRTSLIIAQRLSTIKHADRIVVLRDGCVAEEGTHATLLARGGEYAHLYDLQYREEDEASQSILARLAARRAA